LASTYVLVRLGWCQGAETTEAGGFGAIASDWRDVLDKILNYFEHAQQFN